MMNEVGMLVRERRKEMGLTQAELGNLLHPPVSFAAVSSWERNGDIPDARITELAEVLGVNEGDLRGHARYVSTSEDRFAFADAVSRADLSIEAMVVLMRLVMVEGLCFNRGGSLEFVGSHETIAKTARNLSTSQVASVWDEVLGSGFVERKSDAEWHLALTLPYEFDSEP